MAFDAHANLAYSLVAIAPSPADSGTQLTVADASVFPAAPFNAVVYPIGDQPLPTNAEIVRVTNVVGNVFTFTRTAESGGVNRSILVGDQIVAALTKKTITDIESAIPSTVGLISAINVSAGLTSNNLSALTFNNSNGVSFGLSASVVTATVATNYQSQGAYLTTAALSQDSSKYAGTAGAITGGSITVNTSGVSVNLPAYLTTAMGSNRGSDFVQATAGFFGTNASGTIASDGISISVSAPAGTQSNQTVGLYASSNTYLTSSGTVDARSLSFRGDKSITVGISSGEVVFSVGAYLTTAMGSNRGSDFVQAAAAFHGTNASGTIASDNLSISVAAQTNQSAIKGFGVSNTGQTAGNTGLSTGIDWVLAGSQSLTLSQSTAVGGPNTVWIQHPAWITTAMQSNAVTLSNINVSGGTTSSNLSAIKLVDSNGVSWSLDTGSKIYATVKTDYLTTAMASNRGSDFVQATAGFNGTNASGTIASNSISVSVAAPIPIATAVNAVASANSTGTVTRYAPEDHRHAGIGAVGISTSGNTAGTTGSVQGTYWFQGGNSITVSQITSNNGSHTLVVSAGNYITTAMASNRGSDFVAATAGFNGTNASGTIASNSISVSVAAQSNQSAIKAFGVSNTGQTAGNTGLSTGIDWVLAGSQSLTLSQSTAGGGPNTVWIQHPAWITTAMQSNAATISNINVSGGTTSSNLSAIKFVDSQGVSWSLDTGSKLYATVKTDYLTSQSTQFLALTLGGNTAGTTTFHASNNASLFLHGGNNVTLSGSGSSVTISAFNQTTQSAIKGLGVSNTGNTSGNTGISTGIDWVIAASGNATASQSTTVGGPNTVWISVASAAPSPVNFSAGTTSNNLGSVTFADSNGVSFGLNGSTITATVSSYSTVGTATAAYSVASANSVGTVTRWAAEDHRHAGVGGIGISTGNTSGTSGSVLGSYWIAGSNAISVSQITSNNGSHTLNIYGPGPLSYFKFAELAGATVTTSFAQSTSIIQPMMLQDAHSFDRARVVVSGSCAASSTQATTGNTSLSMSAVTSHNLVFYSRKTGASSLSLGYVTSTQVVDQCLMTISYNANSTQYSVSLRYTIGSESFTKDYSASSGTVEWRTSHITDLTGVKYCDLPMGLSLSQGQYWFAYGRSTTNATQNGSISVATRMLVSMNSMMAISQNTLVMGMLGGNTNSSVMPYPGLGSFTTGGGAGTTSSVDMSAISSHSSNQVFHAQLMKF